MSAFRCFNTLMRLIDEGMSEAEAIEKLKDSYDDHEIELALARYNKNSEKLN